MLCKHAACDPLGMKMPHPIYARYADQEEVHHVIVVRDHCLQTHLLREVARRHKRIVWTPGTNDQPIPVFQCYFSGRGLEGVDIALVSVSLYTPPRSAKIEHTHHQDCCD